VENRDNAQSAGMVGLAGKCPLPRPGRRQKIALNLFIFSRLPPAYFISAALCALRHAGRFDAGAKALQTLYLTSPGAEITDEN
jgi:hypothetical protein